VDLLEGLHLRYGVLATELRLLTDGLDEAARTFRVGVGNGPDLALRLAAGDPRPVTYLVPLHLRDSGVDAVVAPLPTMTGEAFVKVDGLTWSLYPFVDGADGWTHGMDEQDWHNLGSALRAVHDVPPADAVVPREAFDVTRYDGLTAWNAASRQVGPDDPRRDFAAVWQEHEPTAGAMLDQMRVLAPLLRRRPRQDVLCHGDLHPGNLLIGADGIHIIDWGDVLLAPRERDFIYVPDDGTAEDAQVLASSFFRGYGLRQAQVDWPTLAYYRCERVVQDVIGWAETVLGANEMDGAEVERAVHWLRMVFVPGDDVGRGPSRLPPSPGGPRRDQRLSVSGRRAQLTHLVLTLPPCRSWPAS
jgi:spectinomycin phosphotransferase